MENIKIDDLMSKYGILVNGIISKFTNNEWDREDLTSEVWTKIYKSMDRFDKKKSFIPWLSTITYNCCVDFTRKKKLNTTVLTDINAVAKEDDKNGKRILLKEALSKLSDRERFIIVSHHIDGVSVKNLSKQLGISKSNVKVILYRAREKLRNILLVSKNDTQK